MTLSHVLMISNPGSGNNRKWQAGVAARMTAYPQVRHHVTHSPQEAEALADVLGNGDLALRSDLHRASHEYYCDM